MPPPWCASRYTQFELGGFAWDYGIGDTIKCGKPHKTVQFENKSGLRVEFKIDFVCAPTRLHVLRAHVGVRRTCQVVH